MDKSNLETGKNASEASKTGNGNAEYMQSAGNKLRGFFSRRGSKFNLFIHRHKEIGLQFQSSKLTNIHNFMKIDYHFVHYLYNNFSFKFTPVSGFYDNFSNCIYNID